MRYLLSNVLTLFLSAYLVTHSIAWGKDNPQDVANARREITGQANIKNAQTKGEADLLLEKLKKRKDRVIVRCLENCNDSKDMTGGQIIDKPQPVYPADAREKNISGEVIVRVVVDEAGRVLAAQAVSGHAMLRKAAVSAAKKTRFTPTKLSGQSVKVTGVIQYNFVIQ